ncbi:hypothetical protein D9M68_823080 [compost metagenome]
MVPGGEPRGFGTPAQAVETVVDVAQGAADGNVPDGKGRIGQGRRFGIQLAQTGLCLEREGIQQRLQWCLAFAFVAPEDEHVQQTVAEGLPALRRPSGGPVLGEQRTFGQIIQVLADHTRVEQGETVVQHQRGNFGQGVVLHQAFVGLEHGGHGTYQLQLGQQVELVGTHHDLAHVG